MDQETVATVYQNLDEKYFTDWEKESEKWETNGIYSEVLKMLELSESGIHVDLGIGTGIFLKNIYETQKKLKILGIEISHTIIQKCDELFQNLGIPVKSLILREYELIDGKIWLAPNKNIYPSINEGISLICDDIRDLIVTKKILNEQKIDSASLLFPGLGSAQAWQYPYEIKELTGTERILILSEILGKIRISALEFMTKYMKPNGKAVIAERIAIQNLKEFFETMGNDKRILKYWNITLNVLENTSTHEKSSINWWDDGKKSDKNNVAVGIITLTRNQIEFNGGF